MDDCKIGDIFNLMQIDDFYKRKDGRKMAKVHCILCGKTKDIYYSSLTNKKYTSYICQIKKHNLSKHKLYSVYHNIKDRCYNPNCHAYKNYGAKNINICNEWLGKNGFINFYNWALNNGYKENLTIDRIDANKDYSPENCRFVTLSENVASSNKSSQHRKANKGRYYAISPNGDYYEFDNANKFGIEHNLKPSGIRDAANKRLKSYKMWHFGFIIDLTTTQSTIENVTAKKDDSE